MIVIVEGTCGAGKTTLVRSAPALFGDRDVRLMLQRETYGALAVKEDDGSIDDAGNRAILLGLVAHLRELDGARRLVVVDTLHATHFVRVGALSIESFEEVDRALGAIGARVIVLRIGERALRERVIEGRRGTGFERYAQKFGASAHARLRYFVGEQQRLLEVLATRSGLPRVVVDGELPCGPALRALATP